mmetsp:Transcript_25209/g.100353  ORF Transcript_25209/g.100353 Transcript_25209/m.100353 type:complete len:90 (+) Transcript_25209:500-769(+)
MGPSGAGKSTLLNTLSGRVNGAVATLARGPSHRASSIEHRIAAWSTRDRAPCRRSRDRKRRAHRHDVGLRQVRHRRAAGRRPAAGAHDL